MMIESISAITNLGGEVAGAERATLSFADFLQSELVQAESKIQMAEEQVQALALGETDNLHQVMTALSKAQTAFELVVEVRNKLLEGYQEVMRMQI
jgi:flagellar hook-basal body complex protein FliE